MKTYLSKFSLVIFWMIFSNNPIFSQNQIWGVGNNSVVFPIAGLPEATPLPTGPDLDIDYQGQPAEYASNAYHNPLTGALLFFIVDGIVYDGEGYRINILQGLINDVGARRMTGDSKIFVIPFPDDCTKYYIFGGAPTIEFAFPPYTAEPRHRPCYAILDMSLTRSSYNQGRIGELVTFTNESVLKSLWSLVPVNQRFEPGFSTKTGFSSLAITPKNANGGASTILV